MCSMCMCMCMCMCWEFHWLEDPVVSETVLSHFFATVFVQIVDLLLFRKATSVLGMHIWCVIIVIILNLTEAKRISTCMIPYDIHIPCSQYLSSTVRSQALNLFFNEAKRFVLVLKFICNLFLFMFYICFSMFPNLL